MKKVINAEPNQRVKTIFSISLNISSTNSHHNLLLESRILGKNYLLGLGLLGVTSLLFVFSLV